LIAIREQYHYATDSMVSVVISFLLKRGMHIAQVRHSRSVLSGNLTS